MNEQAGKGENGSTDPCDRPGVQGAQFPATGRYWEIDTARGVAICMMVLFHLLFDLNFLGIMQWPGPVTFWRIFAAMTAGLFLFLVGLSFSISAAHACRVLDRREWYLKYLKRGIFIFLLGIGVTIATWLYLGNGYVVFGILHLIGISVIILPFFYRHTWVSLATGAGIILAGLWFQTLSGPAYLLWLGIHPDLFYSVDYTPLFPWFGIVLVGLWAGKVLYPGGTKRYLCSAAPPEPAQAFMILGRHSLVIYLVHQPVIILVIILLTGSWYG